MVFALAIVLATALSAQGATATWDRNTEPDVSGYKLSYGTQPGVHTVTIDVGNVTTHTFNPPPGYRYYVAVRAYNLAGQLSQMSGEVVLDVPAATGGVLDNASAPIVVDVRPLDTTLFFEDYNFSASGWLFVYTSPATRVAAAMLLKFNLSQIPADATVVSATLNLSMIATDESVAPTNFIMSLHQVLGRNPDLARATGRTANGVTEWTANECCMGGSPMAQADISAVRTLTIVDRTLGLKMFDATSLARAWLAAPATNHGLVLNPDTSRATDGFRIFASMEDPVAAQRPFLRVTYTVPVSLP